MSKIKNFSGRYYFLLILFVLAVIALGARLVDLHIFNHDFLSEQGDLRTVRTVVLPAYRGMILDRHGEPLAVSTPVDSIWINPKEYFEVPEDVTPLAELLDLPVSDLAQRLHANQQREFLYLKRQLSPEEAENILLLDIPGVYAQREYRRFYPLGEVAAHLVGVTNIDGQGQEGVELAFDKVLSGQSGKKRVLKDRLGQVIEDIELIVPNQDGQHLHLSIDRRIQYLAYRELKAVVSEQQAKGGSIIILDVNTGEVLAMANQPAFNPNNRGDRLPADMRNRAVTDMMEPGSTMKPLTMAAILATGKVDFDTEVETTPGFMRVNGHTVKDYRDYGLLSLAMVLRYSSNVGIAKLLLPLPMDEISQTWQQLGLSQTTHSGLPGEQAGRLAISPELDTFSYATLGFGYGLSVTALQLAHAYTILAGEGTQYPVSLLRLEESPEGQQVLDAKVARAVSEMLILQSDDSGTGLRARIPGYHVAGKTGTTRKVSALGGYDEDRHYALFAGFAPALNPRIVVVVVIDEPGQESAGGLVAAPVFAQVMSGALRLLNIKPDNVPASVN